MDAKRRFVLGGSLLLASVCFVLLGSALWSGIEVRHREVDRPVACLAITGAPCPPTRVVTAPTHAPALMLFVVAAGAGAFGLVLVRSQPRRSIRNG